MLLLRLVLFSSRIPPPPPPLLLHRNLTTIISSSSPFLLPQNYTNGDVSSNPRKRGRRSERRVVEKESEFEIDRDKAREALEKLDQQLQTLSRKETLPAKNRAASSSSYSDLNLDRDLITGTRTEEMQEFSVSFFTYSAVALLILTIFNNIMFNLFIKPSVDGDEPAPTIIRKSESGLSMQKAPPLSD